MSETPEEPTGPRRVIGTPSTAPTAVDVQVLQELSKIAGVTADELAKQIFTVGSPLLSLTPKDVVVADCKDYEEGGFRFSVSQVEELSFAYFDDKKAALFEALEQYRAKREEVAASGYAGIVLRQCGALCG